MAILMAMSSYSVAEAKNNLPGAAGPDAGGRGGDDHAARRAGGAAGAGAGHKAHLGADRHGVAGKVRIKSPSPMDSVT